MYTNSGATKKIDFAGQVIDDYSPPFVIGEISGNHNGKIDTALKLIEQAKWAGANAVKLQTYTADTITLKSSKPDFCIKGGLWNGRTLHDLYHEAHTPWVWHKELFDYAKQIGISLFSSPFDKTAVDLLESLNAPAYKVASFELVDLPLIRYIASTGKPMIMSTGMANADEIQEAVDAAHSAGCREIALLHCVSAYPANASDYNLRTLVDMKNRFGTLVGLSDHTLDNTTAITSVALGASIIEKHFTLDRQGGGPDDSFSLEPIDLKQLCVGARTAWEALGKVNYERAESERGNIKFRRSLYFVRDLDAGQVITEHDVRSVRPGFGLPPKMLDTLMGAKTTRAVEANTAVQEGDYTQVIRI